MNDLNKLTADELATAWMAAKQSEDAANKHRVMIEEEIITRFPKKDEGAHTYTLDSGLKIELSGKLNYKANIDQLKKLCAAGGVSINLWPIKTKEELDSTGAKYLRNNEPEIWSKMAPAITITPAKTAVKVKI